MYELKIVFWPRIPFQSVTVAIHPGNTSRNDVVWEVALGRPVLKPLTAGSCRRVLRISVMRWLRAFSKFWWTSTSPHFYLWDPSPPHPSPVRDLRLIFLSRRLCSQWNNTYCLVYINIQNESGRKRLYLSSKVNGNFIFVSVNKGEYQKSIFVEINEIHERSLSLGEA